VGPRAGLDTEARGKIFDSAGDRIPVAQSVVRRPHFAAQNSHGHAKEFLRKLSTIWPRALKTFASSILCNPPKS
jgi:hypothetical protein